MTSESIDDSNRILRQQHRPGLDRHTILRKTLIAWPRVQCSVPQQSRQMPRSRLALLHLRLPSLVLPLGSLVHLLASVVFLPLGSVALLLALALVAPLASLVSVILLVFEVVVTVLGVTFMGAPQPTAMADLHAIATAAIGDEVDTTASIPMAIMALPLPMPMTAATTPTATGGRGA